MIESEILRFLGAGASLAALGVVMGISPTLVAETLRVLTGITRAYRAIAFMLLGLTIGATLILLLLQVVDPRTFEALLRGDVERLLVHRSVDLAAGAVFVIAAIIMGLRLRRSPTPRRPRSRPSGRAWEMTLIGATNTLLGFSGFATMYLAARVMRAVSEDDALRVFSYAVFVLAMLAPYVLLAWAWRRFPPSRRESRDSSPVSQGSIPARGRPG